MVITEKRREITIKKNLEREKNNNKLRKEEKW